MTDRRMFLASSLLGLASAFASTSTGLAAGGNDMARIAELVSSKLALLTDSYNAQAKSLITPVYNVVGYGAKGDGVTDDTAAIQAAITAAGTNPTVYFPEGTFIVNTTILFSSLGKVKVFGPGTIKLINNAGDLIEMLKFDTCSSVHVEGITIDGNSANQTNRANGLAIHGTTGEAFISGVTIKNIKTGAGYSLGDGIKVNSDGNFKIIGCHFENTGRNGISVANGGNGSIIGNTFDTIGYLGIDVEPDSGSNVTNVHIEGNIITNSSGGINVRGTAAVAQCGNVTISGNHIQTLSTSVREGIAVVDTNNVTVVGNLVDVAYSYGIYVYATSSPVFSGTVVDNILVADNIVLSRYTGSTLFYPIYVQSAHATNYVTNVKIVGNYAQGIGHTAAIYGIAVVKADGLDVSGNTVRDMGGIGIFLQNSNRTVAARNVVLNNGRIGPANQGVRTSGCATLLVDENIITDTQATKTQSYGLYLTTTTGAVVRNNYLTGNATGPFYADSQDYDYDAAFTRKEKVASAAPTTGTWSVGDVVWNSAAAASGYIGWVCVTAGTPGTWKTFGAISA